MIKAIEQGYPQLEIAKAAYRFQKDVEEGRYVVVGVNAYKEKEEGGIPTLKIDPAVERDQAERVRKFRAARDHGAANRALAELGTSAKDGTNLMPRILKAVKCGVTLGEVVDVLKREFGEWREPPVYW
jgi:methylmalonyl-CoA mutase N-terminal domain/subunit